MSGRTTPLAALAACLAAAAALALAPLAQAQDTGSGRGGVALKRVGRFDLPTYVAGAPGFPRLVFVVEKRGRIRVLRRGRKLRAPFLDIRGLVRQSEFDERGLLSVAFPPDYPRSRRFYVYFTDNQGDLRIEEYRRRSPTRAARGSRRPLLEIRHRAASNHNGGQLQFRGQMLYIGTGDGGSSGDPPNNAQSTRSLLGKILRIDPRNPRGAVDYSIPRSNPFVGRPGRDEIFALGLRNPWRFSFDRNRIAIADVGQDRFEEVNYTTLGTAKGANFGWDAFEGFAPYDCGGSCPNAGTPDPGGTRKPIFAYGRGRGCTVVGGYVVRDGPLRSLRRRYVYTDLCSGQLRSFVPHLSRAGKDRRLGPRLTNPSSFGEDGRGRLYVVSLDGPVFRLVPR